MQILRQAIREQVIFGNNLSDDAFHVGLSGTANYIPYIGITIMSFHKANPDMSFVFHLFVSSLSQMERKRLRKASEEMNCEIHIYLVNDEIFKSIVYGMYTASFWYRFIMPDIVCDQTDRLLYVDADIMCFGSVAELKNMNLDGRIAAVVADLGGSISAKKLNVQGYFNSGMMLINVKQWVKLRILKQIIDFSQQMLPKIDKSGKCKEWKNARYNDQNILNKVLDQRITWLHRKYNYIYQMHRTSLFRKAPYNEDYRDQVLLHFAGKAKPWVDWVQHWPVTQEYRSIWLASPWREIPLTVPKERKQFHDAARTYRKQHDYKKMLFWYAKYFFSRM